MNRKYLKSINGIKKGDKVTYKNAFNVSFTGIVVSVSEDVYKTFTTLQAQIKDNNEIIISRHIGDVKKINP